MPGKPPHLTDREYRLLLYIEELARAEDLMKQQTRLKFGDAASFSIASHDAGARLARKLARRLRKGNVPGWDSPSDPTKKEKA